MDFFFGFTEKMRELEWKAEPIARSYMPILIEGETGTGKERLARHLHLLRATGGHLVKFLCDSSPGEVFGGIINKEEAAGRLREASQDTFLLKRVHRLPSPVQERILLLLDEIRDPFPFLISTAGDSLEQLAAGGRFLPELLYRISAYRILLPPLRERREDIPQLFRLMLSEAADEKGAPAPAPDARELDILADYSWPGNLRELQNVARGYLLAPGAAALEREINARRAILKTRNPAALKDQVKQASKRVEGEIILRALEQHRWNRRRTAEALQISYRSLMYKMKNCNIRTERADARSFSSAAPKTIVCPTS